MIYLNKYSTRHQRVPSRQTQPWPVRKSKYLCHSQCEWSSPQILSGTQPLLGQHQPNAWESLLTPTFLPPERHERLPQMSTDLSPSPGTRHPVLRCCHRVRAAMVLCNAQRQHERGANSPVGEVISRDGRSHLQRWNKSGRACPETYSGHAHPVRQKSLITHVH